MPGHVLSPRAGDVEDARGHVVEPGAARRRVRRAVQVDHQERPGHSIGDSDGFRRAAFGRPPGEHEGGVGIADVEAGALGVGFALAFPHRVALRDHPVFGPAPPGHPAPCLQPQVQGHVQGRPVDPGLAAGHDLGPYRARQFWTITCIHEVDR